MKIQQFEALEEKVKAIDQAIKALEGALVDSISTADSEDHLFIIAALKRLGERDIITIPYWWHPQPEWTGGDSRDPNNFKLNPPHIYKALVTIN